MKKLLTSINDKTKALIINQKSIKLDNKKYFFEIVNDCICVNIDNNSFVVDDVIDMDNGVFRIEIAGYTIDVSVNDPIEAAYSSDSETGGIVNSPIAGIISKIRVKTGQQVSKGDVLIIISAMKMENKIVSRLNGKIKCINVAEGDQIPSNCNLMEIVTDE